MNAIESNYEKQTSLRHSFGTGLADWMTPVTNGAGQLQHDMTQGGRVRLDAGSTAVNDYARIDIGPITPKPANGGYDAVGLSTTFYYGSGSQTEGNAVTQIGFVEGGTPSRIYHEVNSNTEGTTNGSQPNCLRVSDGTSDLRFSTRAKLPSNAIKSELLWDFKRNEIIHRYQGTFAQRVTSAEAVFPDPTLDYTAKIQHSTKTTSVAQIMFLYDLELAYYKSGRNP